MIYIVNKETNIVTMIYDDSEEANLKYSKTLYTKYKTDLTFELGSKFNVTLSEAKRMVAAQFRENWEKYFNGMKSTIQIPYQGKAIRNGVQKNVTQISAWLVTSGGHLNTILPVFAASPIPIPFVTSDGWTLLDPNYSKLLEGYILAIGKITERCRTTDIKISKAFSLKELNEINITF